MLGEWIKEMIEEGVQRVLELQKQPPKDERKEQAGEGRKGSPGPQAEVQIEQPARLEHGDFSTNIAMQLARVLKRSPMAIAEQICSELNAGDSPLVSKIEIAAPGFINVFINWSEWAKLTREGQEGQEGQPKLQTAGRKIVVEHTSINPNKSAHIGHLRNSCIGDTLVRMLRTAGAEVEVHNYIDDLGNQLADTVVGLLHTPVSGEYARFGDYCWDVYSGLHKQFENQPELVEERTNVLHALEEGQGNLAWVGYITAAQIVREHLEEMQAFGIGYDLLVWESSIVREGFWDAAFEQLKGTPNFIRETSGRLAGCWVLKQGEDSSPFVQGTESGVEPGNAAAEQEMTDDAYGSGFTKDKVLVRSNGILTYTAKDIAYHLWKFGLLGRQFRYSTFAEGVWSTGKQGEDKAFGNADTVINVIDHRQEYPQAMVRQSLEQMGYAEQAARLLHVSYGVVSLSRQTAGELGLDTSDGKSSYAMSGRQGIGMKISVLLDKMEQVIASSRQSPDGLPSRVIAAAAIRYYLLRYNLQTEVIFDLQQATEITGNTGVYLLYTYARSLSVLSKGAEAGAEGVSGAAQPPSHGAEEKHERYALVPDFWPDTLEPAEHALIRQIAGWPELLQAACRELAPHMLCSYAYELSSLFNNFYGACPILKAPAGQRSFRLWLTARFNETLKEVLDALGLPAPERM
ncbi:arginine--tRNA ligase [Paenibacillus pinistramenti]|uniref:arginine--tRNA ligase n=1 Tax=Paenibacillus pinistramenti TaxID=1768003 RepID=UPI001EEFF4B2|nr:arginine--tRNA ligase [Paenibacillus pinistramenti]